MADSPNDHAETTRPKATVPSLLVGFILIHLALHVLIAVLHPWSMTADNQSAIYQGLNPVETATAFMWSNPTYLYLAIFACNIMALAMLYATSRPRRLLLIVTASLATLVWTTRIAFTIATLSYGHLSGANRTFVFGGVEDAIMGITILATASLPVFVVLLRSSFTKNKPTERASPAYK